MSTWNVTLPIAGHAFLTVDADSEESAIKEALEKCSFEHIDTWEAMERFNRGNICYCPSPWEAEAVEDAE